MPLDALSYHGIELQVNVLHSCLCCKFQEWLSYEYNGGLFSSTLTWKKSSAMLFNCVYSSARQLSKPSCKHCLRFIQISTIMKLMLFTLSFKWQLLFFTVLYLHVLKYSWRHHTGLTFFFYRMMACPLKPWSNILFIWYYFPGQRMDLLSFVSLSGEHIHHSLTNSNIRLVTKKVHIQQPCFWIFWILNILREPKTLNSSTNSMVILKNIIHVLTSMYTRNNVKLAPLTIMCNHYEVIFVNVKTSSTTKIYSWGQKYRTCVLLQRRVVIRSADWVCVGRQLWDKEHYIPKLQFNIRRKFIYCSKDIIYSVPSFYYISASVFYAQQDSEISLKKWPLNFIQIHGLHMKSLFRDEYCKMCFL